MPITITYRNTYNVLIVPTVDAVISIEYELKPSKQYTVLCSPLTALETIAIEIYDWASDTWQPFKIGGNLIQMVAGYETILLSEVSAIIRFNKSITANAVGLTLSFD
jgi:hypothetical protein